MVTTHQMLKRIVAGSVSPPSKPVGSLATVNDNFKGSRAPNGLRPLSGLPKSSRCETLNMGGSAGVIQMGPSVASSRFPNGPKLLGWLGVAIVTAIFFHVGDGVKPFILATAIGVALMRRE